MRLRLALLLAVTLLIGCDRDRPETMMDDYLDRVARITGQARPLDSRIVDLSYPRHRDRAIAPPEARGRLRELADYNRCNLTQLIAERNSILGRYWPASQRFDYELRFAHRLGRCQRWLAEHAGDDADLLLKARVDALVSAKQAALPAVWWAATYDSVEFEQQFSIARPWLDHDTTAPLDALRHLARIGVRLREPEDGTDLAALEGALRKIATHPYGGRWARSARGVAVSLNAAAQMLEATDVRRLCPARRATAEARIFETVFQRRYAGRVQPYLSRVHRGGSEWLDAQDALWATHTVQPPAAMMGYRSRTLGRHAGSLWYDLNEANVRHTKAWQRILGACGLMPSAPTPPYPLPD